MSDLTGPAPPPGWRVEVTMPVFGVGVPVGWQSLNKLPTTVRDKIRWDAARREWRQAAYAAIITAQVPRNLGRISATIELRFPDRTVRDPANFEPTIKPVIDAFGPQRVRRSPQKKKDFGIVVELGRGVIPGDDPRYLTRPNPIIGPPLGRQNPIKGVIIVHVQQLAGEA